MYEKKTDQRRCHRIRMTLDTQLRDMKEDKFTYNGTILDMSALGLKITTKKLLNVGQKLYVEFVISENKKLTVETHIVHHQELFLFGHFTNQYGLKLSESMKEDEREFIRYFIKQYSKEKII